jgi:hypothetical protein
MTLQDWGSIGELVGAIAVVITLIYLAKQIRLNTHAMDEGRKLALAQTYQMRSDALQAMLVEAADSDHIAPIIIKLTGLGYPEDVAALSQLSDEEWRRFRMWQIAQQTHWDNMHYQYQQGYLDREYYEDAFKDRVVRLAPTWKALGLTSGRRSFFAEIDRLMSEDARRDAG